MSRLQNFRPIQLLDIYIYGGQHPPQADKFYEELLGLEIMTRYPGASFYASGGYHHHIAANIWNSRGAASKPAGMSGLHEYTLAVDYATIEQITNKLNELKIPTENTATGKRICDPWRVGIILNQIQHCV